MFRYGWIWFFLFALTLTYAAGRALPFILLNGVAPLIHAYPQLRGMFAFDVAIHTLPWIVGIMGVLLLSYAGRYCLRRGSITARMTLFISLVLLATALGEPTGVFFADGWHAVITALYLWLDVLAAAIYTNASTALYVLLFGFFWKVTLVFVLGSIALFYVLIRYYPYKTSLPVVARG